MNWNQFVPYRDHKDLGKIASVYLNDDKTLIKRCFLTNGITANGKPHGKSKEYIIQKWETEANALIRFNGLWFMPRLIEIDMKERYVIQEYCGPDLLTSGFKNIPNIEDQVVEIFRHISSEGLYKINGSLSNMTQKNGQVKMFDFKYLISKSEETRKLEEYSIDNWLSKISPTIVPKLKKLL